MSPGSQCLFSAGGQSRLGEVTVGDVNVVAPFNCVVAGDNAGVEVVRGTGPEPIATSTVRRLVAKWNSTFQRSKQNDLHIR